MLLLTKLPQCSPNFQVMVRCCHSIMNCATNLTEFNFKPKFNEEEQQKILNTLNSSDKNILINLNVSKAKIKSMENYKNKKGPFKTLNDVLEVDGLGIKILEKLCQQIITNPPNNEVINNNNNNIKRQKQILVPPLTTDRLSDISTAVGIHLTPMGVSWAKLSSLDHKLHNWGYKNFSSLPKKMLPNETFKLAIDILKKIPSGDIYVFEGVSSLGLQGQSQPGTMTSYAQQLELTSMLMALINTSPKHNPLFDDTIIENNENNRVYFLKAKLPARLFKTLVGNEKVSAVSTISQLIGINENFSLPCNQINLDEKLKSDYLNQSPPNKELLGQALMLVSAFTDVCICKLSISLSAIAPGRR